MKQKLIVDCAWHIGINGVCIAKIDQQYYSFTYRSADIQNNRLYQIDQTIAERKIRPEKEFANYEYILLGLEKRSGYDVPLGRAITKEEFEKLKQRFKLNEDTISEPFEDVKGAIYGEKYQKKFNAIQIKVSNSEALQLEDELMSKGIEAGNGSSGRVNIRIERGVDYVE